MRTLILAAVILTLTGSVALWNGGMPQVAIGFGATSVGIGLLGEALLLLIAAPKRRGR